MVGRYAYLSCNIDRSVTIWLVGTLIYPVIDRSVTLWFAGTLIYPVI